ncbi:MAG: VWA domain-containing protein, partial [Planctomycetota bacterium]
MEELFRNTLTPAQWAAVAAAPLVIFALYFLKLRREPLEVPSTYLWAKSIEDLRVNSLWQRLRQSLLLLLQLLAVAAAALALLRPGWSGTATTSGRLIFLVDNSASMATEDAAAENGEQRTRLADARERVTALIDQMDRGATAMIVSFAGEPRVVQEFTDNQRRLRDALATIEPTAERTDLRGALELADGLANPTPVSVQEGAPEVDVVPPAPATLMVFSDGRFADVEEFSLGNLDPVYVPIGSTETGNLAVTALETRPSEATTGELMAFVQATNFGAEAAEALVELRRGGRVIDARRLSLPAGESAGATIAIGEATPGVGGGVLEARIARDSLADAGDKLALDDRAVAAINPAEPATVLLVSPGNVALERALGTGRADRLATLLVEEPAFLRGEEYQSAASGGAYDVVVYDRCVPAEAPRASAVYVGVLPPGDAWRDDAGAEPAALSVPQIIDWNRAHPALAHLELGDFDIVDAVRLTPPPGAASLVDASDGPIVAIAGRDGFEDLVIGFPILVE